MTVVPGQHRHRAVVAFVAAFALAVGLGAPAPAAAAEAAAAPAAGSTDLETLVGPVALYPDDLLSIVLPAATFPLQIVEADRWIEANKGNKDAQPKDTWDDSIKALLNYPEVVAKMNDDLEWTSALGEAVATDQTAVMDAVQAFRRKAEGAGNLQSDDKQVVVVEKEVVKIVQADPQIIYVPQYEPQTVIVQQPAPVYPTYYPAPYPVYYATYPPGYTFAAGFFWGATMAYAFDWWGGNIHDDIDIDIDHNVDIDRNVDRNRDVNRERNVSSRATNIDRGRSQQMAQNRQGGWKPSQRPSDVRQGRTSSASQARISDRAGVAQRPSGAAQRPSGAAQRPSAAQRPAASTQRSASTRPSTSNASRAGGARYDNASRYGSSARSSPPSRSAYSGMSSSRSASAQSTRGAASRGSFSRSGGGARRR